jgi:hypothetical protein
LQCVTGGTGWPHQCSATDAGWATRSAMRANAQGLGSSFACGHANLRNDSAGQLRMFRHGKIAEWTTRWRRRSTLRAGPRQLQLVGFAAAQPGSAVMCTRFAKPTRSQERSCCPYRTETSDAHCTSGSRNPGRHKTKRPAERGGGPLVLVSVEVPGIEADSGRCESRKSINQARSAPTPIRPPCQIEHLSARSFVALRRNRPKATSCPM